MRYISFPAMGTTVEAWMRPDQREDPIRDWFAEVEETCSRFLEHSELSALNHAGPGAHRVSRILAGVLETAERARSLTQGLVDVGVGAAVSAWGYDVTFAEVETLDSEPVASPRGDWSYADGQLILGPGTMLDFGGIAKGWTCDRAVEDGLAVVASAGGDLRSADDATVATVLDPWGETAARVAVGWGAMATSSTARRRWTVGGRDVSHIIDPRSMRPTESPVVSMTVVAGTAAAAEAGAKAALLHGVDGLAWADDQDWIDSAIAVWDDGSVYATRGSRRVA